MTQSTDLPEGWIAHDGGECPVAPNAIVEVLRNEGSIQKGRASYFKDDWQGPEWAWFHIIAYKPEQPQ